MHVIRKATKEDVAGAAACYEALFDREDAYGPTTHWQRGVYPTYETARVSEEQGILFVYEKDGEILASMRINHEQNEAYALADWKYPAEGDEVMVIHTLCVHPKVAGQGIGQEMIAWGCDYGRSIGCKVFRWDTCASNVPACTLYKKLGHEVVGVVDTWLEGVIPEKLNLYEMLL